VPHLKFAFSAILFVFGRTSHSPFSYTEQLPTVLYTLSLHDALPIYVWQNLENEILHGLHLSLRSSTAHHLPESCRHRHLNLDASLPPDRLTSLFQNRDVDVNPRHVVQSSDQNDRAQHNPATKTD